MSQQRTTSFDGHSGQHRSDSGYESTLDRAIELTSISWYALGWIGVFLLAALPRLVTRTAWPLSAPEARIAMDALAFVRGESVSPDAAAHPLTTGAVALLVFLFGDSDGTVRLAALLAGMAIPTLLLSLREQIGRGTALAAGFLASISPTLVYLSRETGAASVLVATSLLLLVVLLRGIGQSPGAALFRGAVEAAVVLSSPLGWIALPLTLFAAWRIGFRSPFSRRGLPLTALGFGATLVIVTTGFFTRPNGFAAFFSESLAALWNDRLETIGSRWHLPLFQLIVDEPLIVVPSIVALITVSLAGRSVEAGRATGGIAIWAALSLLVVMLLGGKNPESYGLAVLPLLLLAAVGLEWLVSRIDWSELLTMRGAAFLLTVIMAFLALLSLIGLLMGDIDDLLVWIVTFLLIGIGILAPLTALAVWLGRQIDTPRAPAITLLAILMVAGLALRSSVLLSDTTADRPAQPLLVGDTMPVVRQMTERLTRISRDMTTYQQSVLDPTGGHGMTIVVDETVAQPFQWYFREFPNLIVVAPQDRPPGLDEAHVIVARPDHDVLFQTGIERTNRNYAYQVTNEAALERPNWSKLFRSVLNPAKWRTFADFLIDRRVLAPTGPEQFTLSVRRDVGARLYG